MKKIYIYLILIVSLLLNSCMPSNQSTDNNIDSDHDGYSDEIYFYIKGQRVNAQTGAITYICADPLCNHDKYECPAMQIDPLVGDEIVEYDNKIYFCYQDMQYTSDDPAVPEMTLAYHIAEYDISKNKVTLLFEVEQFGNIIKAYDQYFYFMNNITDTTNPEQVSYTRTLSRVDVINQKHDILYEGLSEAFTISAIDDEYVYLYDIASGTSYSLNISTKEFIEMRAIDMPHNNIDGYYYYMEDDVNDQGQTIKTDLYRKNIETGEVSLIEENVRMQHKYNGYIYYTKSILKEERESAIYCMDISKPDSLTQSESINGGKIYRMKYDGSEKEIIYDGGLSVQFAMNGSFTIFTGRYMAVWGTDYTLNEDGIYVTNLAEDEAYRVLIVDLVTKESKWIGIKQPDSNPVITN